MPGFTCCVPGCYSNSHRDKGLHFYTFPKDPELRHVWLQNVSRAGVNGCFQTFQPTTGHRVCNLHFQGGRKSYSVRVPTIFPLRGVNERKTKRGHTRKKPHTVLLTGLPAGEEQGVLELTASGANMVLLGATAGVGTAITGVEGSAAVIGGVMDTEGSVGQEATEPTPTPTLNYPTTGHSTFVASGHYPSAVHPQLQVVVMGDDSYSLPDCCPSPPCTDHSYSMSSGTTTEELLRKLNEQRDIIALMEVKMKEMKSSIRHLRITEVKLREEIRQKDKVLSSTIMKRKQEGSF